MENNEGEPLFVNLPQFALSVLTLPASNADAERIFSKINCTKTKLRNRLLTSTQAALVRVSESVKNNGGCVKFEPTQKMIAILQSGKIEDNDEHEEDIV